MKRIETARETWAGFASSPKSRTGASHQKISERFAAPGPISQHLPLFITAQGLASWLAKTIKFDARLGAKLRFEPLAGEILREGDEPVFGGTYTSLVIPKNIILTTERHGEVAIALRERYELTEFDVTFSSRLLPDEVAEWQQLVEAALDRLLSRANESDPGGQANA